MASNDPLDEIAHKQRNRSVGAWPRCCNTGPTVSVHHSRCAMRSGNNTGTCPRHVRTHGDNPYVNDGKVDRAVLKPSPERHNPVRNQRVIEPCSGPLHRTIGLKISHQLRAFSSKPTCTPTLPLQTYTVYGSLEYVFIEPNVPPTGVHM